MARQEYLYSGATTAPAKEKARDRDNWTRQGWFRLIAMVLILEVFMPFLVWPVGFPRAILGVIELGIGIVVVVAFAYMMLQDRIPAVMLVIAAATLIWGMVSTFEGQGAAATAWGWWGLFKYPLLGVFAYLVQGWPKDFARFFIKFCVGLLMFQIGVQLVMFALGFPTGDSMGGTFGQKGVIQFTMLVFFIVALALGHWLSTHQWKLLLLVIVLGLIGSSLSGTKFYLIAAALMAAFTLVLHLIRGGQIRQLFLYIFLLGAAAAIIVPVYNSWLVSRGLAPLQNYLQPETLERYLNNDGISNDDFSYNLGRGLAITHAWQQVQRDWTTTLFGYGLGTRSQSTVLGVRGNVLQDDVYGVGTTSLSMWIQEYGLVGLGLFLTLNLWMMIKLFKFARTTSDPYQASIAYGLIMFTFFWPVWLWYQKAWLAGTMMILYWISMGYTFHMIYAPSRRATARRRAAFQRRV